MRSKTFRRKHGKMSRRRRGGENRTPFGRSNTAELNAMEQGYAPTAPPMEQVMAPVKNPFSMLGRSNTSDLVSMEEGNANPQVAIDVEATPDIEMGIVESGGRKRRTRKARKGKKSRKSRRSHRR
jgi:hypothetical protein